MRFLREALNTGSTQAIDPHAAFANYSLEQMSLSDHQESFARLRLEIKELASAKATLEARLATHAKGDFSVESRVATRTTLTDLFGNEAFNGMSFESMSEDIALESLTNVISKIKKTLGQKYDGFMEQARWMHTNVFGVITKGQKYLDGAERSLRSLNTTAGDEKYTSPGIATNYLHFQGRGDVDSVIKGITESTRTFKELMTLSMAIEAEVKEIAYWGVEEMKETLPQIKTERELIDFAKILQRKCMEKAEEATKKHRQAAVDMDGNPLSGGRYVAYKPARRFGQQPEVKLDIKSRGESAPQSLDLPSREQLEAVLDSVRKAGGAIEDNDKVIDKMFDDFINFLDEKTATKALRGGKGSKQNLGWDVYVLLTYAYLFLSFGMLAFAMPGALFPAIVMEVAIIIRLLKIIWRAITGQYIGESTVSKEDANWHIDVEIKSVTYEIMSEFVDILMAYAKYQNGVYRAGLAYVHSSIEVYGGSGKSPI